jgi:aspartate/tyrosine/aromatic aminotransferase
MSFTCCPYDTYQKTQQLLFSQQATLVDRKRCDRQVRAVGGSGAINNQNARAEKMKEMKMYFVFSTDILDKVKKAKKTNSLRTPT